MSKLFINLPVKNLDNSIEFFTKLGFTFNPQFTDERGACMVVGDDAFVMLLVEDFFKTFTTKSLVDTSMTTETIVTVSVDSKEEVDAMVAKALENGAKESNQAQDQDSMYVWSFQDLDNHLWEVFWMDLSALES